MRYIISLSLSLFFNYNYNVSKVRKIEKKINYCKKTEQKMIMKIQEEKTREVRNDPLREPHASILKKCIYEYLFMRD